MLSYCVLDRILCDLRTKKLALREDHVVQCMSVEFKVSILLVLVIAQILNVPTVFSRSVSQYTIVMNRLIRRLSVRHSDTERLNGVSSFSVRVLLW